MIIKFTPEEANKKEEILTSVLLESLREITQEINACLVFQKMFDFSLTNNIVSEYDRESLTTLALLCENHGQNLINFSKWINKHLKTKRKPLTQKELFHAYNNYIQEKYEKREPIIWQNMGNLDAEKKIVLLEQDAI